MDQNYKSFVDVSRAEFVATFPKSKMMIAFVSSLGVRRILISTRIDVDRIFDGVENDA